MNPVFQNEETRTRRKGQADIVVIMSEDEIIYLFLGRILRSKLIKGLLRASKDILLVMGKPVILRPVVAEPESYPWVQHTEKDLQ